MTLQTVRVGVIGTSWWADLMHLPSLASHPQAQIVAVCGRNRERAARLADKYAVPRIFTDYRELLGQPTLDAVVIATPDHLHYAMTMAALDAGLHVLCEKPLALNAQEAGAMLHQAEAKGVQHMTAFTWRWLPHYHHLYELVRSGYLGNCVHATFSYLSGGGIRPRYSWRYDRRHSTGALGNLGAHMIDLVRWLLGDVARVSAQLGTFVARPGPDSRPPAEACDALFLNLVLHSGAHAVIQISEVAHTGERYHAQHVRLHGDAGTLEADLSLAGTDLGRGIIQVESEIRGVRQNEERFTRLALPDHLVADGVAANDYLAPFLHQSAGPRHFIDAILADRRPSPSFCDGLAVQEVMDAALQSYQRGSWIALTPHRPLPDA